MFQNKLTRSILILMLVLIAIPLGYSYYSGGESIFPTISPTNTVNIPHTTPSGIQTTQIRQSKTPYIDVLIPYKELTATSVPRSTPFDLNVFQVVVFINHTNMPVRIIITSPNYIDTTIEDVLYLELVYARHWIYIFVDDIVFIEQVINDKLYYINIYDNKIVRGIYRLQP